MRCRDAMILRRNRSGVVLLVVLWILTILSILALGMGRRTSIDVALTQYAIGKLKSQAASWAGLRYVLERIRQDSFDLKSRSWDTAYQCGFSLKEGETPEDLFGLVKLQGQSFKVDFPVAQGSLKRKDTKFGLRDEDRKINLNALYQQNSGILKHLIILLGFSEEQALEISSAVVDWRDQDHAVTNDPYGAENEEYSFGEYPYRCKNAPFDSLGELLLVKGVSEDVFMALKDYVTVFPKSTSQLSVNIHTAPEIVLRAIGRSMTGPLTNTTSADADALASKIVDYRKGDDGELLTDDDRKIEIRDLALNAKEQSICLSAKKYFKDSSQFLRVRVRGLDEASGAQSSLEAVVFRDDLSIVYWDKN